MELAARSSVGGWLFDEAVAVGRTRPPVDLPNFGQDMIEARSKDGKEWKWWCSSTFWCNLVGPKCKVLQFLQDYGVILLPEGLIEYQPQSHDFGVFPGMLDEPYWLCWQRFIPEFNSLISEINDKLAQPELQPTEEAMLVKSHQWNQSLLWNFVFPTFAWHSDIWIAFLLKSIVTAGATGHSECSLQGKCRLLQVSNMCFVSTPPVTKSSTRLVSQVQDVWKYQSIDCDSWPGFTIICFHILSSWCEVFTWFYPCAAFAWPRSTWQCAGWGAESRRVRWFWTTESLADRNVWCMMTDDL